MSGTARSNFNFTKSFEKTIARYEKLSEGKQIDGNAYIKLRGNFLEAISHDKEQNSEQARVSSDLEHQ